MTITVEVIRSSSRLTSIRESWIDLYHRDPRATAWQDPRLVMPFHRMFVPYIRPRILIARSSDNVVRGILPLGIAYRRIGPIMVRRLQSLIGWHACFPDVLVDPEMPDVVLPAIAAALTRIGWEEFELRRVHPDAWLLDERCPLIALLPEIHATAGEPSSELVLQPDAPSLGGSAAKAFRRKHRRLEESGSVHIGWEETGAAGRMAAVEFVAMHGRLKAHQQQTQTFTYGTAAQDFPDWLTNEISGGRVGLLTVRLDGRMLAGMAVLRGKGRAHSYRSAWEVEAARYGLGILLMQSAIDACHAAGDSTFNLGAGTEPYKSQWLPRVHQLTTLHVERPTWRTCVADTWLTARRTR